MNDSDTAWVAGLFEGEGTIGHTAGKYGGTPLVSLTSTDEDVVRRLHAVVGFGSVYGPYVPKRGRPWWRWSAWGWTNFTAFHEQVGPLLMSRRSRRFLDVLVHKPHEPPPPCGFTIPKTQAGYARHVKRGESPCQPCRDAKAAYMTNWRTERRT